MNINDQGPLAGLRVIDLSIMAAGPWAAGLLAMLGAEVIKVEPPAGDAVRWNLPHQRGMGTNFIAMNVNKRDIILDLKSKEGLAQAMDLVRTCDILVQNFRVGVMERLGMGFETLHEVNPRLIYCAISGYGEHGPLAKDGCGDPLMQAFSGFACLNGAKGETEDAFRFTGLLDLATSSVACASVLAALIERRTTGLGQKVEVSMLETALEMQSTRVGELLSSGVVPRPMGSESPGLVPDRAFDTLDREVFVTVHSDAEWKGFCKAIGKPELETEARFATNASRVANREALHAFLEPIFLTRPAIWWLRVFQRYGVAGTIAHHFETFRYHEQVVANRMIARLNTRWGDISVGGLPWHFAGTPCVVRECPEPGEHTEEILARLREDAARTTTGMAA